MKLIGNTFLRTCDADLQFILSESGVSVPDRLQLQGDMGPLGSSMQSVTTGLRFVQLVCRTLQFPKIPLRTGLR